MMELTPNERYFESCSTCEDIDKPSPSFQEMMKNLHLHDKRTRVEIHKLKKENERLKNEIKNMKAAKSKDEGYVSRQESSTSWEQTIQRGKNGHGIKFETRLFVKDVVLGSATGLVNEGDEILEINEESVQNLSENEAFNFLNISQNAVLKIRRGK
ncbi:Oidioi.mRNA.OKI2018_I69.PAR.g10728.t1.cds [Oikopleura dioica]|uniref:Oidioi.mRNA.OKI2018_I69.PAR.g10728.t1.cds n=1 Tax=Oikopleura dioica TaxID=34765 RepID=A0ABN7RS24_OIKDI|nr:Oidioi.mRNA.OKI2018_I69.PAR.g10728.t1.cds [Oikopleura dioica]